MGSDTQLLSGRRTEHAGQGAENRIREFEFEHWSPQVASHESLSLYESVERGEVLYFPRLGFPLLPQETRFLSDQWSDGKSKNINLRPSADAVRGTVGSASDLEQIRDMVARYASSCEQLISALFPRYLPYCRRGGTSFRPHSIEQHKMSWRKDDTRLHVDSFPSNPVHGLRLLRVFTNINPQGTPRVWRLGEPFRQFAMQFLPRTRGAVPGSAWLMHRLGITKSHRSEYDHLMLQLHDRVKMDLHYQAAARQQEFAFPAGSTWIFFSDQVLHAAMSGQFALEQTYYLDPNGLADARTSPLAVLEELTERKLARQ